MDNNKFVYQYSAKRNSEIEKIRSKYLPRQVSKLDELRKLDNKVQNAGRLSGIILGVVGSLIFGIGVCFMLDVLKAHVWLMFMCFLTGGLLIALAYPVYRHIAEKTKNKLVPMILKISDEILKS